MHGTNNIVKFVDVTLRWHKPNALLNKNECCNQ